MKAFIVVLSFIGCMTIVNVEAQILTAAVIIIGAKILIAKGFVYGAAKGTIVRQVVTNGGIRGKREADPAGEDFNAVLLEQNKNDIDDCTKFLVCALNSKPLNKLDEDEFAIATTFGQADVIDVTLPTVLYDVAAHVGRMAGEKQCRTIYPRCPTKAETLMSEIRKAAAAAGNQ